MNEDWIRTELWDENYFRPGKLGVKRKIYLVPWQGALMSLLLDPVSASPPWRRLDSKNWSQSLFDAFQSLILRFPASWFYITNPDDALSVFMWETKAIEDKYSSGLLLSFEIEPALQGGAQYLSLMFDDKQGIVVISRSDVFEISFYGSDERWQVVATALGLPGFEEGAESPVIH